MKKIVLAITISISMLVSVQIFAQGGPPPPPDNHGTDENQDAGGGAPIGGGTFILMGLAAAYGVKKFYNSKKESIEE
ncbi:MAG: hypothetical protein C0598_06355 [Marinilabiliales bacterium]|nr:MAG: hypothetical protein C0598_06355 [Marinilabiliales bacterium]